jgi:hypothetical protein
MVVLGRDLCLERIRQAEVKLQSLELRTVPSVQKESQP